MGEGIIYESMNLMSLYNLPMIMVCENNLYAQSTNINDYKIVADVIQKISDNYDLYSYNASQFYIKNEHSKLLKEVINQIPKICEKKN